MRSRTLLCGAALFVLATACDQGTTGPSSGAHVAVRFLATGGNVGVSPPGGPARAAAAPLVVQGTNGTLSIDDIHLIVAEMKLEATESSCATTTPQPAPPRQSGDQEGDTAESGHEHLADSGEDSVTDHECPDFEASPFFVDLPLDGSGVEVATDQVPQGTYRAVRFKIESIGSRHRERDEAGDTATTSALLDQIRARFPDWPDRASVRVTGTFTPTDSDPVDFTTYFAAELSVNMPLDPPLDITSSGASRTVTVTVSPDRWFSREDGTVMDLSRLQGTEELPVLGSHMDRGFDHAEVERD